MNKPTNQDYKAFERKLELLDDWRNIPPEKLEPPWCAMDADIEFVIVSVRLGALNAFLRQFSTVQFLSVNDMVNPKLAYGHSVNPRAPCTVLRGTSLLGVEFDLRLIYCPYIARYLVTLDWREMLELIELAPDPTVYIQGSAGDKLVP